MLSVLPSNLPSSMPDLPLELEREIFELAADSCPRDAGRLCLVAHRIKIWIEQSLYHSLVFNLPLSRVPSFLEASASRPAEFFNSHVKKLYMTSMVASRDAERILKLCTGIDELTCWTQLEHVEGLIRVLPRLNKLSVNARTLAAATMEMDLRTMYNLTHLDIVTPCRGTQLLWPLISQLPELRRLCVGNLYFMEHEQLIPVFQSLLETCPKLEQLILITNDGHVLQRVQSQLEDDRVVVIPTFHHPKDLRTYWEDVSLSRGQTDFWRLPKTPISIE